MARNISRGTPRHRDRSGYAPLWIVFIHETKAKYACPVPRCDDMCTQAIYVMNRGKLIAVALCTEHADYAVRELSKPKGKALSGGGCLPDDTIDHPLNFRDHMGAPRRGMRETTT